MKFLLFIDALFEGSRMFVGATSAAFLLSKGMTLADLGILKIIHSLAVFILELPTGICADAWGRKKALLLSSALGVVSFALFTTSQSFLGFVAAELSMAVSLSLWSGTFEAFSVERLSISGEKGDTDRFFHLNSAWNSTALILSGFVGGILFEKNQQIPFIAALTGFAILTSIIIAIPNTQTESNNARADVQSHITGFTKKCIDSFKNGALDPALRPFIAIIVLINMLIQPFIYFWQPYFQSFRTDSKGMSLGMIFAVFNGVIIIASQYAARFGKLSRKQSANISLFGLALFSTFSLVLGFGDFFPVLLTAFCISEVIYTVSMNIIKGQIKSAVPLESLASAFSAVSLFGRVGGIISLWITSWLTSPAAGINLASTRIPFIVSAVAGFQVLFILIIYSLSRSKKRELQHA